MEKYRALSTLNSIGDSVLCINIKGKITYLNAVAGKLTGWSIEDARGQPHDEVFQAENGTTHQPLAHDPLMLAIEHDKIICLPKSSVLIRRDGFKCAIEDSVAPIHERNGSATAGCRTQIVSPDSTRLS